jgi:PAS domain S-box-containing protein
MRKAILLPPVVLAMLSSLAFAAVYYYQAPPIVYSLAALFTIFLSILLFISKNYRNIPASKEATALRLSEEKCRRLIEQASEAIFVFTPDWKCIEVNNAACEMTGYSKEELLTMKVIDLVCPEDLKKTPPRITELSAGKMISSERRFRKKDGTLFYADSVAQLMPDERIVSFIRDTTQRKKAEMALQESEERCRTLIEQASDAIIIFDGNGYFLDVNESFSRQFGYSKKELVGLHGSKILEPAHLLAEPIRLDLLHAGEFVSKERKILHKNGNIIEVEINSKMLLDGRILAIARDITERKKADEDIRASEKKYISLVNSIDGIVWEADAQTFEFSFVSEQAERLLGYPAARWIEDPGFWSSHIHEDDRGQVIDSCIKSTQAKEPHTLEYRMVAADGRCVWLRDIVSVVVENDIPITLRGIMIDITEQKMAELNLREAEEKFRDLVEKSLVGVYIIQHGKMAYVNPRIAEIYGYSQSEIIGQPLLMFADEEEMRWVNENIRLRLSEKKDGVRYEIKGKRKDGSDIYVEAYGSKTRYRGEPAIIGTLIDITERKKIAEELYQSEQKYKLLFDNSPLPMFMYTMPDYSIIDVNYAAVKHYGFSAEEFRQMNVKDLRPVEDVSQFLKKAAEVAMGNLGVWRHKKKDGTIIHVEIIAYDMHYRNEQVRLALANDVTEQLAAKEKLQQSYKEIRLLASHIEKAREEEKIKIAREIHDELGQLLTTIKIDVSCLAKKVGSENDYITTKIKDILELIDETVKTVRRIATELRPGILDDLGLVAAMQWQSNEFEKRSGIRTRFVNSDEDLELPSNLATGLFRIFQESLTNVARHAQATYVSTTLQTVNDRIVLKVSDDGKGFDVSSIGHKRTLGLLGMKERTMMMNGTYDLISEKGKGTTVVISVKLPAG